MCIGIITHGTQNWNVQIFKVKLQMELDPIERWSAGPTMEVGSSGVRALAGGEVNHSGLMVHRDSA